MNWKLLLVLPLLALIIGCASPRGDLQEKGTESDSLIFDELIPLLPSAGEFLDMVHDAGMVYQEGIINPVIDPNHFVLYRNQALNFGVYLTDFSYLLLFERQTESIRYLYHIQGIAKKLGVESYFDDEFFSKLLENLSHPDSVKKISLQQSTLFYNRMNAIGNRDLVFYMTSGSMIEGMFIASQALNHNKLTDNLIDRTIDLAKMFDSYYTYFIISKTNDASLEGFVNDIQKLKQIFSTMAITQSTKSVREQGNLVFKSQIDHNINTEIILSMKLKVESIRNKIVNQKY